MFVERMLSIFDAADLDGNGSIDFSEFIKNEWQVSTTEKGVKFTLHLVQYFKIYKYYIYLCPKLFLVFHGGKSRMKIAQNICPQQHRRKIIPP